MDKSFLATIYVIGIAVFFFVLVIMTIMFIVGKCKHRNDDLYDASYDDDDDDDDDDLGFDYYDNNNR